MDLRIVALLCFAAVAAAATAVLFLVKDLLFGRRLAADTVGDGTVRRLPAASSFQAGRQIDHSFDQLILDTGLGFSPSAAFWFLLWCGLIIAGPMFLWHDDPLLASVGMIAGMGVGLLYFWFRRSRRLRVIREQLPGVFELMARAMRAGGSLDQAVELVGSKASEPLATEFRRCSKQLEMGLSLPDVMNVLARRVRVMEMRIFTTTVAVHRQTGGNIAVTLERMGAVARDRLNYQRQLKATTGAGRFSTALIAVAGVLLFCYMFFFQPEYISRLLAEPIGQMLLALAAVLEVVGLAWVLHMLRTDY